MVAAVEDGVDGVAVVPAPHLLDLDVPEFVRRHIHGWDGSDGSRPGGGHPPIGR
jgi:hypothetical protein